MTPQVIDKFQGKYRWLSNFELAEVVIDGITYQTNEHAYQATKADNLLERLWVASAPTPGKAKKRGALVSKREDWDKIKIDVMYDINLDKFTRHDYLQEKLLATGNAELIEGNEWGDQFWGVTQLGGQNHLGHVIMFVREKLQSQE